MTLSMLCKYSTQKIDITNTDVKDYITTDNLLQDKQGYIPYDGVLNMGKVTSYQKGDVLISNIRPYLKKIWLADKSGGCSNDVLVVRLTNAKVLPKFLYYSLAQDAFFDYVMQGVKGIKMPRGDKAHIMNYTIAVPSIEDQKSIIDEIESYEILIAQARKVMNGCAGRKTEIINRYLQ